jgi:hypothetical protein
MQLEDLTAEVRPRSHWEAVDLGFALVRRHFPRLLAGWLLCVGPLWALLLVLMKWVPPGLVLFVIWWLKPIYGRLPLFHLSRALFGATPRLRDTLRAWPGLLVMRLPFALIGGRLDTQRGLLLPVQMLEGLKGRARKERSKVIARHSGSTAASLLFCCAGFEMFLTFALGSLAFMMLPETATSELFESFIDVGVLRSGIPPSLLWLAVGCWLAAMTLVEIFYIGGSFGLYLNCRTHLEGWDVELTFRRLGKRLAAAAAALALLLCPVAFGAVKRANNSADATAEKAAAHERISTVLAHPDFEIHKTKIRMPKDFKEDGPAADLSGIFNAIGYVIFWAVVAFAVWKLIEFIIKYRHTLKLRAGPKAAIQPVAKSVMGLDVTPESLPEDVVRAAREKWEEGDFHGALSLLYRGSLSWLLVHAALPVRDSDTEGDCLRHTQKLTDAAPRGYFEKLTVQWIAAAYGSRAPANEIMRALFNEWPFGPGEKPA